MATSPIPPMLIEMQLDIKNLQAQLNQVQTGINNVGETVTKSAGKFTRFKEVAMGVFGGNLLTQGMAGIEEGLKKIGEEMQADEIATTRLNQALTNTNNMSAKNKAIIEEQSKAMLGLGFEVSHTETAYGTLITATNNVEASTKLMTMAADLARYKHIDLQTAATILARGTQGSAKAFKELGITLDTTVPKSEAIKKALDELASKTKNQATAYTKTLAGQIEVLKTRFIETAVAIASKIIPVLGAFLQFITQNGQAIMVFVGILAGGIAAYKTYGVIITAINALQKLNIALTLASAQGVGKLKASMLLLNDAMRANPMGAIVTGLMLLGAAFVWAWNKSETFRAIVVKGMQLVGNAIGYVIGAFGTLLNLLSKIPKIGDAFKGISNAVNGFANSVRNASDALDKLIKKKDSVSKTDTGLGNFDFSKILADQDKAAAAAAAKQNLKDVESAQKEADKILADMAKVVEEGQKKSEEAAKKRQAADLVDYKKYNDAKAKLDQKRLEELAQAESKHKERDAKLTESYNAQIKSIEDKYAAAKQKALTDYQKKEKDLRSKNADDITKLEQQAAEKRQGIIQKSIDQLRSAFASGVAFSIADAFKTDSSAGGLLGALKKQLLGAQTLQKNAAALAGAGYSQTFIEEIVKAGPQVGNQMADAILNADSETQAQLKSVYNNLSSITESGMNAIGKQMNDSTHLATQAMLDEYAQVAVDLKASIEQTNAALKDSLDQANTDYMTALDEAQKARDEAAADAFNKLQGDLADSLEAYNQAAKDIQDNFNRDLEEIGKTLSDALEQNKKNYEDTIAQIAEDTKSQLDDLQAKLDETMQKMKDLKAEAAAKAAADAAAKIVAGSKITTPTVVGGSVTEPNPFLAGSAGYVGMTQAEVDAELRRERGNRASITVNANTNADPRQIAAEVGYVIHSSADATYSIVSSSSWRGKAVVD